MRDIGQPSNQNLSGGTYGYGKASLYLASGIRTILVHTRCKINGKFESRFIAAALGQRWADKHHRQFTGRHWWGADGGEVAEPILNRSADELAVSIGMGGFKENETGTTILILDPLLNDRTSGGQSHPDSIERTPIQALNSMAEYALWFFWPKMLNSRAEHVPIEFKFQWEDTPIKLPHPLEFPPLAGFVEAMERFKGARDDESILQTYIKDIASEKPRKHLGRLILQKYFIQQEFAFDTGSTESPFEDITHHTALMRQAELVVKYLEGRPLASSSVGYSGVFIVDRDVDEIFARSEPPTHDDWSPSSLTESWHKTYVRGALRKIGEEMTSFAQVQRASAPVGTLTPLGAFATWLGESLIPAETGTSASRSRPRPSAVLPNFPIRSDTASTPPTTPISSSGTKMIPPNNDLMVQGEHAQGTPFPLSESGSRQVDKDHQNSSEIGTENPTNPSMSRPQQPAPAFPTTATSEESESSFSHKIIRGSSSTEIIYDEIIEYEGRPALLITFDLRHAENADGTTITLKAQAVLDSNVIEDEPPLGGSMAQVVCWISPLSEVFADSNGSIYIAVSQPRESWQVIVLLPDDMMANIELDAKAEIVL